LTTEIIKAPDVGAESAEVVEILVVIGDELETDQSLVVVESDKASLEVPCPMAGTVTAIKVNIGDQLSEGMDIIELEVTSETTEETPELSVEQPETPESAPSNSEGASKSSEDILNTESDFSDSLYLVPDLGADEAEIIEVAVSVGDDISEGDSIVVAESDKASLEVPAEASGTIVALHVSEGDKVQQGTELITIRIASSNSAAVSNENQQPSEKNIPTLTEEAEVPAPQVVSESAPIELLVPDIGSDSAEIIEISASVGDKVAEGDTLVVVETDKASVEMPAESAGEITALHVEVGSKISQGDKLATLMAESAVDSNPDKTIEEVAEQTVVDTPKTLNASKPDKKDIAPVASNIPGDETNSGVYAGPAVRKLARELGVDLASVKATGQRGRILKDDIHNYVKEQLQVSTSSSVESSAGAGIPEIPAVDWSQFGEIDVQAMSRINKMTAANMTRNWLNVPHVTQFDDADVTELEQYRGFLKAEGMARGIKMTPLAFLLKASVIALKENPKFNTALHHNGDDLVERKFFHISIAVDTPLGLMVPVIRDVDQKDIWQLAAEVSGLASKAKEGKLSPKEMQGASFTISSLGAIGGTGFTPIVPAPQVGIMGVSKTATQPVWDGNNFVPRQMMPLALSYDHRVVNGVDAGKFMTCFVEVLSDLNRIWNG